MHMYMCVYIYTCIYTHTYTHIYIYMHIFTHTHTHAQKRHITPQKSPTYIHTRYRYSQRHTRLKRRRVSQKSPSKETYIHAKETCISTTKALYLCKRALYTYIPIVVVARGAEDRSIVVHRTRAQQKRPIPPEKRPLFPPQKPYISAKEPSIHTYPLSLKAEAQKIKASSRIAKEPNKRDLYPRKRALYTYIPVVVVARGAQDKSVIVHRKRA